MCLVSNIQGQVPYPDRVPDPIHKSLADIQSSLATPHVAESKDGSVRAEATARRQTALHLTPAALKMSPATLATVILATQQEAQNKAEAALTTHLNTFREDPRVTTALETLRDTQANPAAAQTSPATKPQPHTEDEETYVDSVYNSDRNW